MGKVDLLAKVKALEATFKANRPKQPRHYAEEIILLKTREERITALENVPESIRHVVKFYVLDHYAKRNRKPLPDLLNRETIEEA